MKKQNDFEIIVQRLSLLEKQNKSLKKWILVILIITPFLIIATCLIDNRIQKNKLNDACNRIPRFSEITVGRINIAGPDSINRIILSHKMPLAPFQGEMLKRNVPPGMAGIIYCAPNGDEVGGIGVSGSKTRGHALITLDYRNTPLEALGMSTWYSKQGQGANFIVMDNPTDTIDIKKIKADDEEEIKRLQAMMIDRISLGVNDNDATLTIKDRNGKVRIIIGVDANNNPKIKILDKNGDEVAGL